MINVDYLGISCAGLAENATYRCISYDGLPLDNDQECVLIEERCDDTRDCPFGDDEWDCNRYDGLSDDCTQDNGYFECVNSPQSDYLSTSRDRPICIRSKYSCVEDEYETWDCPQQEDLTPSLCPANFTRMFVFYICLCVFICHLLFVIFFFSFLGNIFLLFFVIFSPVSNKGGRLVCDFVLILFFFLIFLNFSHKCTMYNNRTMPGSR